MLRKLFVSVAALSLVATPVIAQTAKAPEPATEKAEGSELFGGSMIVTFGLLAALAAIIYLVTSGEDEPASP